MLNKIRNIYTERANEHFLKEKDNWVAFVFEHPFSMPLLRLMQKLNLKIHPNVITFVTLAFTLVTAYFFLEGKLALGAFCYLGYFIVDGADGKWARLTGKTSKLGERLDHYYVGPFGNLAMYFGLWYSQYYLVGNWLIGASIIFAHYIIVVIMWKFLQQPYYRTIFPRVRSYYSLNEEGFGTFFFAPLFNVVTILLPVLVMLQLISFIILLSMQKILIRQQESPDVKTRIKEDVLEI